MQLRMKKDYVLSSDCYSQVASIVAREIESMSGQELVDMIQEQVDEAQSLTSEDNSGDEAHTPVVRPECMDSDSEPEVQGEELGSTAGGDTEPNEVLPETPDAHPILGDVPHTIGEEQSLDSGIQLLEVEWT